MKDNSSLSLAILLLFTFFGTLLSINYFVNINGLFYNNIDDFINDKQTYKLSAYWNNGFRLFDISEKSDYRFVRLEQISMKRLIGMQLLNYTAMIDYKTTPQTIEIINLYTLYNFNKDMNEKIINTLLNLAELNAKKCQKIYSVIYVHHTMTNKYYQKGYNYTFVNGNIIQWSNRQPYIQMSKQLEY